MKKEIVLFKYSYDMQENLLIKQKLNAVYDGMNYYELFMPDSNTNTGSFIKKSLIDDITNIAATKPIYLTKENDKLALSHFQWCTKHRFFNLKKEYEKAQKRLIAFKDISVVERK